MIIYHYGSSFVKIGLGDRVMAIDPSPGGQVRFGADLALCSRRGPEHCGLAEVSRGDKHPFVIDGPGEYELGGIFIQGLSVGDRTVFLIIWDDIRLVHLAAGVAPEVPPPVQESLGVVDILFLPLDMGSKSAGAVSSTLAPKLIVPIAYSDRGALSQFLKEAGAEDNSPQASLTIRKKDLVAGEVKVAVVDSR